MSGSKSIPKLDDAGLDETAGFRSRDGYHGFAVTETDTEAIPQAPRPYHFWDDSMAIEFKCQKCGKGYKVRDEQAGKRMNCRECSATTRIPADAVERIDDEKDGRPPPQPRTPKRKRSSVAKGGSSKKKAKEQSASIKPIIYVGVGVGLLVLGGLIWGIEAILSSGDGGDQNPAVADQKVETTSPAENPVTAAEVKKHMSPEQHELGDPIANSVGMVMVPIPLGKFQMGMGSSDLVKSANPINIRYDQYSQPQHTVVISKQFYISATEVTQDQWNSVMGTTPWKDGITPLLEGRAKEGAFFAATRMSWDEAVEFCNKLSEREGVKYRLPTEAE